MKKTGKSKTGQIALLLMFLLTGLVLLFSLNIELFKATRTKLRLQNIADASAMAVARWQGMTLNLIGDLNIAHIKAINDILPANGDTTNFIAGITALQRHLKSIGPLIGFDAANRLARDNGASASAGMKEATELIAKCTDPAYSELIRKISDSGVYAGIDNTKTPTGILTNPRFYKAVQQNDFATLCELSGYHHTLPAAGTLVPSKEDMFHRGCVGYIGVNEHSFSNQAYSINLIIDSLVSISKSAGYAKANIKPENLTTNESIILSAEHAMMWNTFDSYEWRPVPSSLSPGNFPWIDGNHINPEHAIMGGSCTIRVEDVFVTTNSEHKSGTGIYRDGKINPIQRFNADNIDHKEIRHVIVAQSAAKTFAKWTSGAPVTTQTLNPPLIVPAFSSARYVPFAFGANGRDAMADIEHVAGFPRNSGDPSAYQAILDKYHSEEFRAKAHKWFTGNEHNVICCPPSAGPGKTGGGTDRVP